MTPCKRGDVVLLPFPFTDLSATKQRPAVVISSEEFNARQRDIIVLAITSQIPSTPGPDDYPLSRGDQEAAGLPKPSLVKCGKLLTIDQRLIRKAMGRLPPETLTRLTQRLLGLLG
jgi:mRNA interferase MazF